MDNIKTPVPEKTGRTEEKKISMPDILTVSPSPHVKSTEKTSTLMLDVLIALTPAFIWGIYMSGIRALVLALISIGACIGFEALYEKLMHKPITVSDLSAVVTGLLLAMNLPATAPLWMPVVGALFAIVIVKQLFGGIGKNFVNPALAARVFLFSWAGDMSRFQEVGVRVNSILPVIPEADIVASATPLASLKAGVVPERSILDMFFGTTGGSIGELSALLLLIGGIYLLVRKTITWHIPVAYIGTVAVLTVVFSRFEGGNNLSFMLYELFSGGLLLAAFFMATDYSTSPVSPRGRIIYGIGCGLITVMIRYFGSYPEGCSFAILIMNLLVWYLDRAGMPRRFGGEGFLSKLSKGRKKEGGEKSGGK